MILNKWRLEAVVRQEPGLTIKEFAARVGVSVPTALRHAGKHRSIIVEVGRPGRGRPTRLWLKHDPPSHLQDDEQADQAKTSKRGLRVYTLDDF